MVKYDPEKIEEKWQKYWQETDLHKTDLNAKKPYYCLDMFPYPSGEGLHVGHWSGYVYSDVWSRYKTLQGYEVMHPMGWDAFGLPAENAAIKNDTHPDEYTKKAIKNFTRQLKEIGAMYDWDLEVNSSDPDYYKWTQWIFLKLFKNDLAYQKKAQVNYCPSCQTVLANEQVVNGLCERCDSKVKQKSVKQWFFKITQFADQLLGDLKHLDWPERVKKMQKNWIGKSHGAQIRFPVKEKEEIIEVYTTRPDTLFGATYLALAPENEMAKKLTLEGQKEKVKQYINEAQNKSLLDRKKGKGKKGVFTGSYGINPINKKEIPIYVADYVLPEYGTGSIMAVPAHDQRDFEFAQENDIEIIEVISPDGNVHKLDEAYEGEGELINSQKFNGETSKNARKFITKELADEGLAEFKQNYKLKDWLISRQRYWGTPIPVVHCKKCGAVPVDEEDLPVKLPKLEDFKPGEGGQSPLAQNDEFVNTTCPKCGGKAKRETDTMDTFVDSSWYFLRYPSSDLKSAPYDRKLVSKWLPVDKYVGGVEHAVMHLLYARFITKALHSLDLLDIEEPFKSLFNQGMIYRNGKKMSKSKGNSISPDKLVENYGRDTVRGYELFIGPPEQDKEWKDQGIEGVYRFLKKTNRIIKEKEIVSKPIKKQSAQINELIENINTDLESFHLNTIVSSLMEFVNDLSKDKKLNKKVVEKFLIVFSPVFPHLAEELWEEIGNTPSIFNESWPHAKKVAQIKEAYEVVIQVNGNKRGVLEVAKDLAKEEIIEKAKKLDNVLEYIDGKTIRKEIVVDRDDADRPPKLINIVVG